MPKKETRPSALIPRPPVPLDQKIAWTIADAADACSVSISTIRNLIRSGVIKPSRVFGKPLLNPVELRRVLFGEDQKQE